MREALTPVEDSKSALEKKDFKKVTDRHAPKTMADIEKNLWKQNVKEGSRSKKDVLDCGNEDFSNHTSKGIDGRDIVPSSFNIFRDSLRSASEKLHDTLVSHLPELNLKEITDSESEADDEDVLPLDFRTAMIEKENRVVIQAKPLSFKEYNQDEEEAKQRNMHSMDSYLDMARREAFGEEEGAVMIEPDFNIKDKFEKILLPCMQEERINNTMNAPVKRSPQKQSKTHLLDQKTYDTDTDTNQVSEDEQINSKQS